ncbi:hypothetical protein CHF27_013185 [Romboutsia maritimum]|uniref:Uncharacterized protein n=1 Tax=Romboutsia maritimum TaxID=2020948 RepID=A0A371IPS3_9FIRM|nr:hypothetical protein [Romboutsia maritimum]RDY22479.1 hypothetical protein CHF27_013185 [Romboutsia maritimum]
MSNVKIYDKFIYSAILVILIYSVAIALRHPISWALATIAILPLVYICSSKIGNLKTKLMVTKILSIIYGIISIGIFVICFLSGFVENGTILTSLKNLIDNSALIFGFLVLSIFIYRKVKYEKESC